MSAERHERGQRFLSLETVAEVYRVESVWLREVYDLGLLRSGIVRDATVWIGVVELDRVATIVRMSSVVGRDPAAIGLLLGDWPDTSR